MPQAFASAADLATLLQRTFSPAESAAADEILTLATGVIQDHIHQTVTTVYDDVAVLYGNWGPKLELPERPVVGVTSMAMNGTTLVADVDYWWPGLNTVIRGPRPSTGVYTSDQPRVGDWGGPNMAVSVTYTHGFEPVPASLKNICLAVATRALGAVPAGGVARESVGGYSVDYITGAMLLSDAEKSVLSRFRRTWQ